MGDTNTTTTEESPGDLRRQRDDLSNENKTLKSRLDALERDEQLRDAGLGHLSKRQRNVILRDIADEGKEFSADTATSIAKEYGWPTEPTPTPTPSTSDTPPPPSGNGDTNGGEDDDMTAFQLIEEARREAISGRDSDFQTEMKKANSPEELRDIIRTKGPRHKMIHEWDVP